MDIQSIKEKLKKAWDLVLSPEEKIALKSAKTELEKIKLDEVIKFVTPIKENQSITKNTSAVLSVIL